MAWNGGCAFIGAGGGAVSPHAHYAIQLVLGMPSGLKVQVGRMGSWEPCSAALIPSRATHRIDVTDCEWSAVVFVEPETIEGRALTCRLQRRMEVLGGDVIVPAAKRLERAWRKEQSADSVRSVCRELTHELSHTASQEPSDPRILATVEHIRQHVDESISLEQAASLAHLSPGRFRHLFVEETGMPLRRYVLWRRLLHVWSVLMQGETLSAAAHAAGFSDSSHLTRTSRAMFGLAPSMMQMRGPLSARSASRRTKVTAGDGLDRMGGGSSI